MSASELSTPPDPGIAPGRWRPNSAQSRVPHTSGLASVKGHFAQHLGRAQSCRALSRPWHQQLERLGGW